MVERCVLLARVAEQPLSGCPTQQNGSVGRPHGNSVAVGTRAVADRPSGTKTLLLLMYVYGWRVRRGRQCMPHL